ncbi:hypothetical protein GTA51_19965 [Desulfovibrio aerotolerans]|uniref:Uncharacterized protein n=1 Tax=Solidesulfovibrio aerotolerans TaxID=295255 RepID=A0A7C9N4H9_9BACT|nr:hypothetical protein [Solidesulfovibrio aerotolerans]MYL85371.1 hypothetical protein [Solidesulfovibrio aerotolerans]
MSQNKGCNCRQCEHGKCYKGIITKYVTEPKATNPEEKEVFLATFNQVVVTCDIHLKQFVIYQQCLDDFSLKYADTIIQFEECEGYSPRGQNNVD